MGDFADALKRPAGPGKVDLNPENAQKGLVALVLALLKLVHELLERQAVHRLESGSLSPEQTEQLGTTLRKQAEELDRLRKQFGLSEEELNLDLGPLGRLFEGGTKR